MFYDDFFIKFHIRKISILCNGSGIPSTIIDHCLYFGFKSCFLFDCVYLCKSFLNINGDILKIKRLYSQKSIKYSNKEIFEGFKNKDRKILEFVYLEYYWQFSKYIVKGGKLKEADAKDIFQDGLVILWDNIQNKNVELKYNFITYFFGICKKLLCVRLRQEYKFCIDEDFNLEQIPDEVETLISQFFPFSERDFHGYHELEYHLLNKHYFKLGDDCKKILKMAYSGISYEEIAKTLGYKKGTFAKNKKYRCKEYLIASIKKDSLFKLLK